MSIRRAVAIGLAGFFLNCLCLGPFALRSAVREMQGDVPHFGDFTGFYVGACMAGTDAQYDPTTALRMQKSLTGGVQAHLIPSRLPFYYASLRPLCSLPYVPAHRAWLVFILLAALSATVLLWFSQGEIAIAAVLSSAPLLFSIMGSQDVALLLLVLAGGFGLRKAGRPWAAGCLVSLLSIKFHLFLLLPVLFLVKREYRLLGGAASGSAVLLALCFAGAGRVWPARYASLLLNPALGPGMESMPNLHGAVSHLAFATVLEALLTLLVVAVSVRVMVRAPFSVSFGTALVGGILISRHAYMADCAVLAPGLIAIWQEADPLSRKIALICLLPFAYWLAELLNYGQVAVILFLLLLIALTRVPAAVRPDVA